MPSASDGTATAAPFMLISLAVARLACISSLSFSGVFKGGLQRLLSGFVTTKGKLIVMDSKTD